MRSSGTVVAVVPARAGSKGIPGRTSGPSVGGRSSAVPSRQRSARRPSTPWWCRRTGTPSPPRPQPPVPWWSAAQPSSRVTRRPRSRRCSTPSTPSRRRATRTSRTSTTGTTSTTTRGPRLPAGHLAVHRPRRPGRRGPPRARRPRGRGVFAAAPSHAFLWRTDAQGGRSRSTTTPPSDRAARTGNPSTARPAPSTSCARGASGSTDTASFGRVELAVVDPRGAIDVDDPADLALASSLAHTLDRPAATRRPRTQIAQRRGPQPHPGPPVGPLAATTDRVPNANLKPRTNADPHPSQQNGTP